MMSLFVFSIFAGMLIHGITSVIQSDYGSSNLYRRLLIGRRIIVWLPERSFLAIKAAILSISYLSFVLTAILIVAQSAHPSQGFAFRFTEAVTSPRMAAVIFGGFVGFLLGNLISRVARGNSLNAFKSSDWLEVFLIVVLVILGIGGEEFIRSSAARINKISVGATNEISFSEAKSSNRVTEYASNAVKPSPSVGNQSDYLKSGGSSGLLTNATLGKTINTDQNYFHLFKRYERLPKLSVGAELSSDETFVSVTISPLASCLAGIFARTGNKKYVEDRLSNIVTAFNQANLQTGNSEGRRRGFAEELNAQINNVFDRVYDVGLKDIVSKTLFSENEIQFVRACTSLVSLLCLPDMKDGVKPWTDEKLRLEWIIKIDGSPNPDGIKVVQNCIDVPQPSNPPPESGLISPLPQSPRESLKGLKKQLIEDSIPLDITEAARKRPYWTIGYAGFLAQLGYYDWAALQLDGWVSNTTDSGFPERWYLLRARFALAGYLEEWIRSNSDSVPLSLRQYHIDNFLAIIRTMENLATIAEVQKLSGESKLEIGLLGATFSGDNGDCNAKDMDERKHLAWLYQSYISAVAGFIDHSLKHREDAKKNAAAISTYTRQLNKISLKCLVDNEVKEEKRAEILEYYARDQLNLVENTMMVKSTDVLQQQIKNAAQVVRLAIELIDKRQSDERIDKAKKSFLLRISSSSIIERYESLLGTQQVLSSKARELADN